MQLLNSISIKRKLSLIIAGISSVTIIIGMVIVMLVSIDDMRENLMETSIKNAELMATYSSVPLVFNDEKKAEEVLKELTLIPAIQEAVIYTKNRKIFAEYYKDSATVVELLPVKEFFAEYMDSYLHVFRPINRYEELHGYLYLVVSTEELDAKIKDTVVIFLIIILFLITASYILSSILQRSITKPVINLADIMAHVTRLEDYSIRVDVNDRNELGTLYTCFNDMLGKIETTSGELKNSEKRFRAIFNSANDAIFIHDIRDGKIIDVNETTLEMYEIRDKASIIGRTVRDISSNRNGYTAERLQKLFGNVLETRQAMITEWQARKTNGVFFWIEVNIDVVALLGQDRILVIARDITKRKHAEEDMLLAKKYVDNIINSMPSIIAGVDSNGMITHWNREAEKNTGIVPENAIGNEITELLPSLIPDIKDIMSSIKKQKQFTITKSKQDRSGQLKYEQISVFPLLTEHFTGAVVRIDDISEQKRFEEMVTQSEKMLSVGGLAAGMAHEINNPLAGIMASIEVIRLRLKNKPKNEKLAQESGVSLEGVSRYFEVSQINKKIEMMHDLVKRASKIVQDMLDFSRQDDALLRPGDLRETVDKTLELAAQDYNLKKHYDFRKINIEKAFDPGLPVIHYHESRIQQVFLNIIKNGAEAMDEFVGKGGYTNGSRPEFRISVRDVGDFIRVRIADNGPGIDLETQKRIFEPFFTTKEIGVGTGLGLSVSYFIVSEHHKGNMSVESEPGNGAAFIVELPKITEKNDINY